MAASASTIVLVTGANSGVGYAITEVLTSARAAYHVIMAGRSQAKLSTAEGEIKSKKETRPDSTSTLVLDVTDESSITRAADEVSRKFGRVDVLVNNAGVASKEPTRLGRLDDTFRANVFGPVLVTEAFTGLLLKSAAPRVVQVTSGLGSIHQASLAPEPNWLEYRMSKAALNMYMVEVNKELREKGVKVFGLCPGLVRSNLRGSDESEVSAGGRAVDAVVSGRLVQDVIEGRRDADVGKVVKFHGTWEW